MPNPIAALMKGIDTLVGVIAPAFDSVVGQLVFIILIAVGLVLVLAGGYVLFFTSHPSPRSESEQEK